MCLVQTHAHSTMVNFRIVRVLLTVLYRLVLQEYESYDNISKINANHDGSKAWLFLVYTYYSPWCLLLHLFLIQSKFGGKSICSATLNRDWNLKHLKVFQMLHLDVKQVSDYWYDIDWVQQYVLWNISGNTLNPFFQKVTNWCCVF